jgi:GT2 family glycosyltransferase
MSIFDVTAVFTSCGRWELLQTTVDSFIKTNTYPIKEYIVIDNSTQINAKNTLQNIFKHTKIKTTLIINRENIGQVASIDLAYSQVNTKYIFHCEDDWLFLSPSYVERSIDVLEHDKTISNTNVRVRFDGEKGSDHPVGKQFITSTGTKYYIYQQNYLGMWHGFSWNPGLRRLSDYQNLGLPYKKIGQEQHVGNLYKEKGFFAACLEDGYAKHIGTHSITPLSNM